jgi:hypothetical protein
VLEPFGETGAGPDGEIVIAPGTGKGVAVGVGLGVGVTVGVGLEVGVGVGPDGVGVGLGAGAGEGDGEAVGLLYSTMSYATPAANVNVPGVAGNVTVASMTTPYLGRV